MKKLTTIGILFLLGSQLGTAQGLYTNYYVDGVYAGTSTYGYGGSGGCG